MSDDAKTASPARWTIVSPSPRDLLAQLSDDEKVAIDLILQDEADARLGLLAGPGRLGYLRSLAAQLRALGVSLGESVPFDQVRATWEEARRRHEERRAALSRALSRALEEEEDRVREQQRLQALPPEARRSVERRRRRQRRRGGPR